MQYIRVETENGGVWAIEEGEQARLLDKAPYLGGKETGETLPLSAVKLLAPCEANKMVCIGRAGNNL